MAWTHQEEDVYKIVREQLESADSEKKQAMLEHFDTLFFPAKGANGVQTKWKTSESNEVTRITVWGHLHFMNNLRLAMMKEKLGFGPNRYCIVQSGASNFESKLLLLVTNLPHEKMFFYPNKRTLGGPFLHSPWKEISEAIWNRFPLSRQDLEIVFTPHYYL